MSLRALVLAVCVVWSGLAGGAGAAPYQLVAGDRLEVTHSGSAQPITATVDADGQIRLADLGGVTVAGLSLDDAQAQLTAAMQEAQLYIEPRVSLSILDYARIVVAGDVTAPGRFEYVPGMTIATALALAGGGQTAGLTRTEIARSRADLEAGLLTTNLEIAAAVARLSRFTALQSDAPLVLTSEMSDMIPARASLDMDKLLNNERRLLENTRKRSTDLEAFWAEEINRIEDQIVFFDQRVVVQNEIVALASEALDAAKKLQERGLQTNQRLVAAQQREADARSRVIELESSKTSAIRAIGNAKRERIQYRATQKEEALTGLQRALVELDTLQVRYNRIRTQLALFSGGGGSLLGSEAEIIRFALVSLREGRAALTELDLTTPLLPGDTLLVTLTTGADGQDF